MSYTPEQLLEILSNYEKLTDNSLLKNAKGKEKKKLDPKAKVRNRGTVCVPAESAKDKKDHFPINDEGQARSALSRVEGLSSAPWYSGTLEGLKALVKKKVHSKYPSIGKSEKKKKSAERLAVLTKISQVTEPAGKDLLTASRFDRLIRKYSEEGQAVDRLIAKYSQKLDLPDLGTNTLNGGGGQTLNNSPEALASYTKNLVAVVQQLGTEFSQYLGNNQEIYNKILEGARSGNVSKDDLNQLFTAIDGDLKTGNNGQAAEGDMKTTLEKARNAGQAIMNVLPAAQPAQNQSVNPADPNANDPSMGPVYNPGKPAVSGRPRHQAVKTKAGYDVKKIQETLKARDPSVNLGPTGADGDWGNLTNTAFQKWKAANNLQAVTDDEAIKRLMSGAAMPSASGDKTAPNAGTHAPIPAPPPVQPKAPPQQLSEVPLHINQLVQQTGQLFQQAQKMEQTVGRKQIQNPAQIQQWFQTVQHLEKQVANAKAWGNRLPQQSANDAAGAETQLRFIKDILNRLVKKTKGMG